MGWAWSPVGALGVAAAVLCSILALVVWRAGPTRDVNRRLVMLLAGEAVTVGSGFGVALLAADAVSALAWYRVHAVAVVLFPAIYLNFIATFETPVVRFLKPLVVRAGLGVVAVAIAGLVAARPEVLVREMRPSATLIWEPVLTEHAPLVFLVNLIVPLFCLVAAISAWRRAAPASIKRERGGAVALAFGTRDLLFAASVAAVGAPASQLHVVGLLLVPLATVLFVTLLVYAIVHSQIFDIDLRIKVALRRSTVVSAFVAAFLVGSELLERLLPVDGLILGLVSAAALAAALTPIRRFSARVADRLLPGVRDDPEYIERRKTEVYRAALEQTLLEDGTRAREDERFLADLRDELGIMPAAHTAVDLVSRARRGLPGGLVASRYRLVRPLGTGGSGEVFLARDLDDGREVALKRLLGDAARGPAAVAKFAREARLARSVRHARLVEVIDVLDVHGEPCLVMEFAPGGSLAQRLPLPEAAAVDVARDVLDGLAALHEHGILHRDVKPSNVLLDDHGRAKLADFTLAHDVVSGDTVGAAGERPVGTYAFMAPEVARGLPATVKSDLYSVAATLYAALAGKPPIGVEGLPEHEARARIARDAPLLPLAGVTARTNVTLARGLAKVPGERFASAEEMRAALGEIPASF